MINISHIKAFLALFLLLPFSLNASGHQNQDALDLTPARWIWYPSERTLQNTFILFRKDFELTAKPDCAKGWVLADSRYRLFINGKRVQWGPAPSDPRYQEADPLDVASYLVPGHNVIALEVCYWGIGDGTQPLGKPGLIFSLDVDGLEIVSDNSWDCTIAKSWRPGQYRRWFLRSLQEEFDARLYPYGWIEREYELGGQWHKAVAVSVDGKYSSICNDYQEYAWDIFGSRDMSQIRQRSIPMMKESLVPASALEESHYLVWKHPVEDYFEMLVPDSFEKCSNMAVDVSKNGDLTVNPDEDHSAVLTFSFEEQGVGWPYFTIDAPEGTIVELLVHEAHQVGGPSLINSHFNSWSRFICKEGRNMFETFDFESFRWLQLHIRNFDRPVKISSVGMRRRIYPWKTQPHIAVSDDTVQTVLNAAVNTLYNCAQETLVDGMARERQQYSGDGSHQMHSVFQVLGDSSLPGRFVNTFSQGCTMEGFFLDCWPGWDRLARLPQRQMGLTQWGPLLDHGIGFCMDAYHYYMYTGDLDGLSEVYPRLLRFFNYLKTLVSKQDGLIPSENLGMCSVYIDHNAFLRPRHKQLSLNLYTVAMCRDYLAPLCTVFGDTLQAQQVRVFGSEILSSCHKRFWDPSRRVFVDNLPWEKEEGTTRFSDRALSTALIYDLCPEGQYENSLAILTSRPDNMGESYPCNAVWPLWAYIKYHRIDLVLQDLRHKWGNMRSVWENNTLQEFFVAQPDQSSQWSHCAMYPLIALTQGIAGAYPITPGGKRVSIHPQLGDLEHVSFEIQTPSGPIGFAADGGKSGHTLTLDVPEGVTVELKLDARENVRLPLLGCRGDERVYLVNSGRYTIKLRK